MAGRFVAWSDAGDDRVFVYDHVAERLSYTAHIGMRTGVADLAFDLQHDGKVAAVYRSRAAASQERAFRVAWFAPRTGRKHVLPVKALDRRISFGRDRIALFRANGDLVLSDLEGRTHRIAAFTERALSVGSIAFDGRYLTWAANRIDRSERDCPNRSGRRCFTRASGVTSILLTDVRRIPPQTRLMGRQSFRDVVFHP